MGAHLTVPLEPLNNGAGVSGGIPNWAHMMPRDVRFDTSDVSPTWDEQVVDERQSEMMFREIEFQCLRILN